MNLSALRVHFVLLLLILSYFVLLLLFCLIIIIIVIAVLAFSISNSKTFSRTSGVSHQHLTKQEAFPQAFLI